MPARTDDTQSLAEGSERYLILGTAGHIDHGKTSLIRALTDVDTDRLPEEKRRGMTIELGFAELIIGSLHLGIVDVPGHERFVRTMVSGATGINLALIVVAADDSVMPQTSEHVEILDLLDVAGAVVAVTKTDVVDDDLVELVVEDVRSFLQNTRFAQAPIVPVSSVTGGGVDEVKTALASAATTIPGQDPDPPFRMAIDRVFTVQGRGTVVTGSVLRGQAAVGDTLTVWPGGFDCRIRDLQTHGRASERVLCGQRAALNLIGVDRDTLDRGCELATPGYLYPTRCIDVALTLLPSADRPLKPSGTVRLCVGTREVFVRVVPLQREPIRPGHTCYAQLRADERIIAAHGQHFILRDEVASRTIGGGRVLRPNARRWRSDRDTERAALAVLAGDDATARVEEVLRFAGFDPPDDRTVCCHAGVESRELPAIYKALDEAGRRQPIEKDGKRLATAAIDNLLDRAESWLDRFHRSHPDIPGCRVDAFLGWLERKSAKGLGPVLLDRLVRTERVKILGQYVCRPEFAPALSNQDEKILSAMIDEYYEAAFQPPELEKLRIAADANKQRLVRLARIAESTAQLIRVRDSMFLHPARERELRDIVRTLASDGNGVTVSQIRERLNSSRKYMVPIVEYLDRIGFTQREGDLRFVREELTP